MKESNLYLIVFVVIFFSACSKPENKPNPEENIQFSTSIDAVQVIVKDTLPITIAISSKLPTQGVQVSMVTMWNDSSRQIQRIDTSINQSQLSLNIIGLNKSGSYSTSISITSRSTSSNTTTKSTNYTRNSFILNSFTIPIQINGVTNSNLMTGIDGSVSGTIYTIKNGKEHLIVSPTLFFSYPLLPALNFIKNGATWSLENSYVSGAMGAGRNYECIDSNNQTWTIADFGLELTGGQWPGGSIYVLKTIGNQLTYSNISSSRSYYHSVSTGDLNNDGLKDIVGLNMGTLGNWFGNLHPYLQQPDGSYSEARDLINDGLNTWSINKGAGAVLVGNLFGDERPEIIRADYGLNLNYQQQSDRYSFVIYAYDNVLGKYTVVKNPGPLGVYTNNDRGTTSIKFLDFDRDGDLDLALATEGTNFNGIEIWQNNGNGDFLPTGNKLELTFDQMQFREFEVLDINNDGWLDIALNPFHYGRLFRVGGSGSNTGTGGVYLNNLLWINNRGNFSMYNKSIVVPTIKPAYLKIAKISGVIKFIGLETSLSTSSVNLYEIPILIN